MKKYSYNQRGFGTVEVLLVLIIIILIGVVGWFVYQNQHKTITNGVKTASSTSSATQENSTSLKTFTDPVGNFSVQYPASWQLTTKTDNAQAGLATSTSTLVSPTGTVLHLNSDHGGRGGECQPASSDTPFHAGNTCPTLEYLSSEVLPIKNVYYAHQNPSTSGNITFDYVPTDIVLTTSHYADPSGTSTYMVGATESHEPQPVEVNKPAMGLFLPIEFFTVYDANGKDYPYVYVYATGSDASFLKSSDVTTIKSIIRSLKVTI